MEAAAGAVGFVFAGAFGPETAAMGFDDAASNGKAQPRPTAFEFGSAAGMVGDFAGLVEFSEDEFQRFRVDADAGVFDDDFNGIGGKVGVGWVAIPMTAVDVNSAAVGCVFYGVVQDIAEYDWQDFFVAFYKG